MRSFPSKRVLFVTLVTLAISLVVAGASGVLYRRAGLSHPRRHRYQHNPLVSDIFRAPIYFNRMLQQAHEQAMMSSGRSTSAVRYTVTENETAMILEIEVPGVAVADLVVELEGNDMLRVKGSRKPPLSLHATRETTNTDDVESVADTTDPIDLSFEISDSVEAEQMTASLSAGILRVHVPKKVKEIKRIAIATD